MYYMKISIDIEDIKSKGILVFGDASIRGKTPLENLVAQTLVNQTKKRYPHVVFMHIKNEGKKTADQAKFDKTMGQVKGASDFIFVGYPCMALEVKRANHKDASITTEQIEFLQRVIASGGIGALALGSHGAVEALEYFISKQKKPV